MKAFPTSNWKNIAPIANGYDEGMDLRDYFAAKAMQSLMLNNAHQEVLKACGLTAEKARQKTAEVAYQLADAMMEARHEKV